jgi:hypothetical protein
MPIKVTIQPKNNIVTSVNIGPKPSLNLGQILNVDASNPDDGEALVYDAATNKYVIREISVNANNITNLAGGTF